ncbi:DUF397 domain-containing protein [Actinoallomurus purpureus]|nr:DUF397 domain-containing protein [Actinoallomurus purpureus]MCO6010239.1 DUF397 domain-containing protein [Actinoallomurus purpureus]
MTDWRKSSRSDSGGGQCVEVVVGGREEIEHP